MKKPTSEEQLEFRFECSMEPCDHVKYLMRIGGFADMEEYGAWLRAPMDDWDDPDWLEGALREIHWFDEGYCDDDDPGVLEYMNNYAEAWLEEKENRLIRRYDAESRNAQIAITRGEA